MDVTRRGICQGAAASAFFIPRAASAETQSEKRQKLVDALVRNYQVPGLSVALASNGRVVYSAVSGVSDAATGTPLKSSDRFRIASLSKPFTAVGTITWAAKNGVDLDKPIPLNFSNMLPGWADITWRQLLTHTSGCPGNDDCHDPMFVAGYANLSDQQFANQIASTRCLNSDGAGGCSASPIPRAYRYSNFGYFLLGYFLKTTYNKCSNSAATPNDIVIECQESGFVEGSIGYEALMQQYVFAPRNIKTMSLGTNQTQADEVKYVSHTGGNPYGFNISRMAAHGGWIATAQDVALFAATALQNLASNVVTKMATPTPESLSAKAPYGEGWMIGGTPPSSSLPFLWHNGSLPGTASILWRSPNGDAYAALVNCDTGLRVNGKDLLTAMDDLGYALFRT